GDDDLFGDDVVELGGRPGIEVLSLDYPVRASCVPGALLGDLSARLLIQRWRDEHDGSRGAFQSDLDLLKQLEVEVVGVSSSESENARGVVFEAAQHRMCSRRFPFHLRVEHVDYLVALQQTIEAVADLVPVALCEIIEIDERGRTTLSGFPAQGGLAGAPRSDEDCVVRDGHCPPSAFGACRRSRLARAWAYAFLASSTSICSWSE